MKLMLAESRLLKDSVNIISDLVSDVRIKLDKDKLEIVAMDPANVAMVIFRLMNSAFLEYDVSKEESFGVNLDSLRQVLGRSKPTDTVILQMEEGKNRLNIKLVGDSTRNFNLGLIDLQERDHKVPDLEFSATVETHTHVFNEAVEDMDIIADSIGLSIGEGKLVVSAEGTTSDAKVEILEGESTTLKSEDVAKAKYSVEYLKKIIKGSKLADKVKVKFGNDYPLQIEYDVPEKLYLSTILAPRVENR